MAVAPVTGQSFRPASGTSLTMSYATAPTAGDSLLIAVGIPNNTTTVSSITDPNGNTFVQIERITYVNGGANRALELWKCASVSGSPASITVSISVSTAIVVSYEEYSGVVSIGTATTATGASTNPSIAATLLNANDFLVAAVGTEGNPTYTAQNGTIETHADNTAGGTSAGIIDNTAATASLVTDSCTLSLTEGWGMIAVNISAVSSGINFNETLTASIGSFAGAIAKRTGKLLTSGMSAFSGALSAIKVARKTLTASMAAFSATLSTLKITTFLKTLTAAMSAFSGSLGTSHILAPVNAKLEVFPTGGSGYVDYSAWLYGGSTGSGSAIVKKQHKLNQPQICTFSLQNGTTGLTVPAIGNRVRISTPTFPKFFTGYVIAAPTPTILGKHPVTGNPVYSFSFTCASEETRLEWQSATIFPTLLPFTNQTQGQIIKALIARLGGGFDVTNVQDGILIPYFRVKPSEGFMDAVRRLSDHTQMKFWTERGFAFYASYADASFGYSPDETQQTQFDPSLLQIAPLNNDIFNDVTGIGSVPEPQAYVDEYFLGDGFTASFPLKLQMYGSTSSILLQDDFSEAALDPDTWNITDLNGKVSLLSGSIRLSGGVLQPVARVTAAQGVELAGKVEIRAGLVMFNQPTDAIIGALMRADSGLLTDCVVAFRATKNSDGVNTNLQPFLNGVAVGPVFQTVQGLTYQLSIYIDTPIHTSNNIPFFSRKNSFGGGVVPTQASVSFRVTEVGNTATALPIPVLQYSGTLAQANVPDWAFYSAFCGPYSNTSTSVLFTLNSLLIKHPYQAELWTKSSLVTSSDIFNRPAIGTYWTDVDNGFSTTGSAAAFPTGAAGTNNSAFFNNGVDVYPNDQFSQIFVSQTLGATEDTAGIGPSVRLSGTSGHASGYCYYGTGENRYLVKFVNGVKTFLWQLFQVSQPSTGLVKGDLLRLEIVGSTVTAYYNGNVDVQITDTAVTAGNPGMYALSDGTPDIQTNNWSGGSLVPDPSINSPWVRRKLGDKSDPEADAAIIPASQGTTIQFFTNNTPEVAEFIRVVYRQAGYPRVRVQDATSITAMAAAEGDAGIRANTLPSQNPSPRNSFEMESAIRAYIDDYTSTVYQGTWTVQQKSYPLTTVPLPGRLMTVNVPSQFPTFTELVNEVDSRLIISKSGQDYFEIDVTIGPLYRLDEIQMQWTPPADALIGQYDTVTPLTIQQQSTAPGSSFSSDRPNATFDLVRTPTTLEIDMGAAPDLNYEVRKSDAMWGTGANLNLISTPATEKFTVTRDSIDLAVYVKNVDATSKLSRFPAVIRLALPLVPNAPNASVDISDPANPKITIGSQFFDDPSAYGYQINDANGNILHRVSGLGLLLSDLVFVASGNTSRSLSYSITVFNLLGEQSTALVLTATIPTPSVSGLAVDETNVKLTWVGANASSYLVEVATDAGFTNIVLSKTVTDQFLTLDLATVLRQNFYRVTPQDDIGSGTSVSISHAHTPTGVGHWVNTDDLYSIPAMPTPLTDISVTPTGFTPYTDELRQVARELRVQNNF